MSKRRDRRTNKRRERAGSKRQFRSNKRQAGRPLFPPHTYYIQTMPGLEKLAWREVQDKLPGAKQQTTLRISNQNGLLAFTLQPATSDLLQLRTAEDVFFTMDSQEALPRSKRALSILAEMVEQRVIWPAVLKVHREVTGYRPKSGWQTTFRVISRLIGNFPFHRREAQHWIEKSTLKANPRWVLVKDNSVLEIWLTILPQAQALVGLRLSDRTMRHRTYDFEHLPASLRPTVAATMVMLSDPVGDDVFLDPMCGAGTILIERAEWGRYRQLLGGDINHEAVTIAGYNIGDKYKPITLQEWDATNLAELASHSVDKVVSNLPFGQQIGSHEENLRLYSGFLAEMRRVVRPRGRMVLLSGDADLLYRNLKAIPEFAILEVVPITLLGTRAKIFVIDKQ